MANSRPTLFSFKATPTNRCLENTDVIIKKLQFTNQYDCALKNEGTISPKTYDNAFSFIPEIEKEIIITSDSPLLRFQGPLIKLPKNIRSVKYLIFSEKNTAAQTHFDFLKKLPTSVSNLNINVKLKWINNQLSFLPFADFKEIISHVPSHITSITIPNIFTEYPDEQLAEIFAAVPPHITKINAAHWEPDKDAVEDKQLKRVLINMPFSVTKLIVSINGSTCLRWGLNERPIDMKSFRNENYFPKSYVSIANQPEHGKQESDNELFEKAKRILIDYTKGDSLWPGATLFLTLHWNRHHIDQVNLCLRISKNFDELYNNIKNIASQCTEKNSFNKTGSLARRIRYIEFLRESRQAEQGDSFKPYFATPSY